jgi:dCMP deaminase
MSKGKGRKITLIRRRPSFPQLFMNICEMVAERSLCLKIKTASIVVKGSQILAIGYNGTQSGAVECSEHWYKCWCDEGKAGGNFQQWIETDGFKVRHRTWSIAEEIHAEANALAWISKRDVLAHSNDYVMYTLYSPCDTCAKTIINHGIKKLYYRKLYKHGSDALTRLREFGVDVYKI